MTEPAQTEPCQKKCSGGRPCREDAEARHRRMLDVAQEIFLTQGYAETTLDRIACEAGVAKKTLYEHFSDKAGLFAAVMQRLRREWTAVLHDIVIEPADLQGALQRVAEHLLEVGTRSDMLALHRLLLVESRRFPDLMNGACTDMAPLAEVLRRAVGGGLLDLDDVDLAAEQFVYLVLGGLRVRMLRGVCARPEADVRAHIARQAVRIFLQGSVHGRAALDSGRKG